MSAACSREEISECRGLGVVSGEDLTRQGREGHFVDPGRPAGRDRRRGAARISWIGELEDLERAVAVTGVKGCERSRGDRQNAIRAGNAVVGGGWGGRLDPGKAERAADLCQAGSGKDIDTGIGAVADKDVAKHRVGEADVKCTEIPARIHQGVPRGDRNKHGRRENYIRDGRAGGCCHCDHAHQP